MKELNDTMNLGVTFQMSLDAFLEESNPVKHTNIESYTVALLKLEESKKVRSQNKKQEIAKQALSICPDCIEAYMVLGLCEEDYLERIHIFKEGMELATMNLGNEFFLSERQDYFTSREAKPYFHIKFAYAEVLYEAGFMRKAQSQFQEILNMNPSDVFRTRDYLYALALYFEEYEVCKQLLERFDIQDTMHSYIRFLYHIKKEEIKKAKGMLPSLKQQNHYLYDIITYRAMNTSSLYKNYQAGSTEEAGYIYHILLKVIQSMEYLHIFMVKNES